MVMELYDLLWVGHVLFLCGWCNKLESKVALPNVSAGQVLRLRRKTQNQSEAASCHGRTERCVRAYILYYNYKSKIRTKGSGYKVPNN